MTYKDAKGVLKLPDGVASEDAIRAVRDGNTRGPVAGLVRLVLLEDDMVAVNSAGFDLIVAACAENDRLDKLNADRIAELEAQVAAMLPVVDAAVAWLDGTHDVGQQDALIRAIEAYQGEAHQ